MQTIDNELILELKFEVETSEFIKAELCTKGNYWHGVFFKPTDDSNTRIVLVPKDLDSRLPNISNVQYLWYKGELHGFKNLKIIEEYFYLCELILPLKI